MKTRKREIMKLIEKGEIKMKPSWWFLGKKWSKRVGYGVGIVGGAVLLALADFLISLRRAKDYLEYGGVGKELFWEKLPISELIMGLFFWGTAILFFEKIGDNYKMKGWVRLGISLGLAIVTSIIARLVIKNFELELGLRFI